MLLPYAREVVLVRGRIFVTSSINVTKYSYVVEGKYTYKLKVNTLGEIRTKIIIRNELYSHNQNMKSNEINYKYKIVFIFVSYART